MDKSSINRLFSGPCTFMLGAAQTHQFPPPDLPEITFAGRSNVGKSSLINALVNRKDLAKTSNTPGRTQQLNWFDINGTIHLVDMPGYGFAKVPLHEKEKWHNLIEGYLSGREALQCVFVLIDARRGLMPADEDFLFLLERMRKSSRIVITKSDKIKKSELEETIQKMIEILEKYPFAATDIIVTSSQKKLGIDDLRAAIAEFA